MKKRLENVDYIVVLSIVLISILTGLIQHFTSLTIVVGYLEIVGPLVILIASLIIYQIARNSETRVGRHIKIISIGALFFVTGWSHRLIRRYVDLEGWGVPVEFTSAFFVSFAIGGIIIMTYGFYMVKQEAITLQN